MLVSGVVVKDCVDDLAGGNFALDGIEKADQLLMGVPLHAAAEHHAVQDVEGGEQGGGAVALVVVGHGSALPDLSGRPGWVRSSAWIWLFSSIDNTTAWAGGCM